MKAKDLRYALEAALYALVTLDGITAIDNGERYTVDESRTIKIVKEAIRALREEAAENNAVWSDESFVVNR